MIDIIEEELQLIEVFRQKAAQKRHELAIEAIEQRRDNQKRREEIKLRKEEEERKLEEAIATPAQVAAFDERLDEYDTATVHALMDNQHALDLLFAQREELEATAFRLPDGRMAFKTEDGKRVFDQHGAELGLETIHPEAIPGSAPTWEAKQKMDAEEARLLRERDQLHSYQQRLDTAREKAGQDDVSGDALAKMDADLRQAMPDAVKARLPDAAADRAAPAVQEDAALPAYKRPAGPALAIGAP